MAEQRDILFKYIFSFSDNGMGLKIALNEEISRMKGVIEKNKTSFPELNERVDSLHEMLESFSRKPIDDKMLFKVMKTQEFCKEL